MRYLKTGELKSGMILARTLYDNGQRVLLPANNKITNLNIRQIKRLKFDGIYVFDEDFDIESSMLISEETRIKAVKNLKHVNIDECLFLANKIVEEIKLNSSYIIDELSISSLENDVYTHSINVTLYSVLIGIGMGFSDYELKELSQAALLHDIGKSCIDASILNKPEKLTEDEYEIVKLHSIFGFNILNRNENVSLIVKDAVYSHHENEDGTGYPRGLKSNQINKYAKIIHVADVYDALTSKRVYKESMNPADALEFLYSNINTLFDFEVVNVFKRYVALYPIGCEIKLSNGLCGIIHKNNNTCLSRPIVKLDNGKIINLTNTLNLTIVELHNK